MHLWIHILSCSPYERLRSFPLGQYGPIPCIRAVRHSLLGYPGRSTHTIWTTNVNISSNASLQLSLDSCPVKAGAKQWLTQSRGGWGWEISLLLSFNYCRKEQHTPWSSATKGHPGSDVQTAWSGSQTVPCIFHTRPRWLSLSLGTCQRRQKSAAQHRAFMMQGEFCHGLPSQTFLSNLSCFYYKLMKHLK